MFQTMYILKLLIILLLIVFPFGELLRFDLGQNINLKLLDVFSGLITFWIFILFATKKQKDSKIPWPFLLFPLIALVSLLVNSTWLHPQELFASSLYLVRWVGYIGVFFAVKALEPSFKKKIVSWLVVDGIVILILGFVQYFFYNSLKPYQWLGWDEHMYRMFSVFLDPNFAGGFFVLFFLFIGGLLFHSLQKPKDHHKQILFKKITISPKQQLTGLVLLLLSTLSAIFLTFSRSALLMLLVGAILFLISIRRKKIIVIVLAVMIGFILLISPYFNVESINLFREASSKARLGNYAATIPIIQDRPWLGVGFDTYRYAKKEYGIPYGWVNAPSHADAGVDNSFLFVLVTTGVVGLAAYGFLWFWLLRRTLKMYQKESNVFALIFFTSSIGLFVHAMFINSLFFPEIMLWLWIMLGLAEKRT
jgi:O-antigen ligase